MDKNSIAVILEEMGTLLELSGANPFKARAFATAARALVSSRLPLDDLVASGELLNIKGIGKSTGAIITELAQTGTSREFEALKASLPPGLLQLLAVEGLGPKRVKMLYQDLHVDSLEALDEAARSGKLATLKGFSAKTREKILAGIAKVKTRAARRLYMQAKAAGDRLCELLQQIPVVERTVLAGSVRRMLETAGDVDIVASAQNDVREEILQTVSTIPGVVSLIERSEDGGSFGLLDGSRMKVHVVAPEEFIPAWRHYTGSSEHNKELGRYCAEHGFKLERFALEKSGGPEKKKRRLTFATEEEMFEAIGLQFIPPELREGTGEIAAAAEHRLPRLVDDADIRGTFHCHTTYSDGVHSVEEMAREAQSLGWQYLGIADHSKAAAYAGGLKAEDIRRQWDEIDALNRTHRAFRIFKGTECDILADGSLDWPDEILAGCDYVVASVHSRFGLPEEEMTRRIVKALEHPRVTMLGHPTGRLLLSRDPYAVRMHDVIDAAAAHGKIIEINAHPQRLDLDWRLCREAVEKGVMLVINPDAHATSEIRYVYGGVAVARKGWATKENILNALPLDRVVSSLHRT